MVYVLSFILVEELRVYVGYRNKAIVAVEKECYLPGSPDIWQWRASLPLIEKQPLQGVRAYGKSLLRGWRDDSVDKKTCYSSREL